MTTTQTEAGSSLAIREDQDYWSDKQLAALRQMGVQDATPGDLAVFFHQSQRTGLDPFARQLYMVGRWSREGTKYTIQTGIDGFRLIGRRAADQRRETLEVTDTEWCGEDGKWRDVWLSKEPPAAARVAIIRNGGRFPAVALFHEYAQTKKDGSLTQMWETKGALMIAKCAEALAWRKAFPQDLSGLYTADEMAQADNVRPTVTQAGPPAAKSAQPTAAEVMAGPAETGEVEMITAEQLTVIVDRMKALDLTKDDMLSLASEESKRPIQSSKDLTQEEAATLASRLWDLIEASKSDDAEPIDAEVVETAEAEHDPWAVQ